MNIRFQALAFFGIPGHSLSHYSVSDSSLSESSSRSDAGIKHHAAKKAKSKARKSKKALKKASGVKRSRDLVGLVEQQSALLDEVSAERGGGVGSRGGKGAYSTAKKRSEEVATSSSGAIGLEDDKDNEYGGGGLAATPLSGAPARFGTGMAVRPPDDPSMKLDPRSSSSRKKDKKDFDTRSLEDISM